MKRNFITTALVASMSALAITACEGGAGGAPSGAALGMDTQNGAAASLPWADNGGNAGAADQLTLAVKFVAYTDGSGPVITADEAKAVTQTMNDLFSVCHVHFRAEEYVQVNPADKGLQMHPSSMNELDPIRAQFDDRTKLVITGTGTWDHSGGLGADGANAWTTMPGQDPSGAVLEDKVITMGNLVAHEIGHYLNLDHVSDTSNMMNPVIYGYSNTLTPDQCQQVRQAAQTARKDALR